MDADSRVGLAHTRLSILDLSEAGMQPMASHDGRLHLAFNGEIYNYLELRAEIGGRRWRSTSDTEVLLAAYERWGERCLDRLVGMFSFLLWDSATRRLFVARDRFGVKPLYYHEAADGTLLLASEIKALHAAGVPAEPDERAWATFLARGLHEHSERTFWKGIKALPPGHLLRWRDGRTEIRTWYDLADRVPREPDSRDEDIVREEYVALLHESVRLRFRSDVPVGINLSGGLDSSLLLGLVQSVQGEDSEAKAFTFVTGDSRYDELPWVRQVLARTRHPGIVAELPPKDVPAIARSVQWYEDEPFGGLPTLAYARLFEVAREHGVTVLLDGQGMDEQWAGYDYYSTAAEDRTAPLVQGTRETPVRPSCLMPEFAALSDSFEPPRPFEDAVSDLQYRDLRFTKIPRALRYNDRVSMRASTELREPFLDHRLVELALRQPVERKIGGAEVKRIPRRIARDLLPGGVVEAPKRPLQTPQREWLRGPLVDWANDLIEVALDATGGTWLDESSVRRAWATYREGKGDNSFFVWQWVNMGLMFESTVRPGRTDTLVVGASLRPGKASGMRGWSDR